MPQPLVSCYIYYRVAADYADVAREVIGRVLEALEQRVGIVGRLLHRQDEPLLWMEVYDDVRDAARFEAMLNNLLDQHRFARFLATGSARTVERFVATAAAPGSP